MTGQSFDRRDKFSEIISFLDDIGINTELRSLTSEEFTQCFLPNILLVQGKLIIDPLRSLIGDILHEAGHLAIFPARLRQFCNNSTISTGEAMVEAIELAGLEISESEFNALQYCYDDQAPLGWQYAVNIHLGLDSKTGFHEGFEVEGKAGIHFHDSIKMSLKSNHGHRTSVTLYYLGMIESKSSFPTMLKWVNN